MPRAPQPAPSSLAPIRQPGAPGVSSAFLPARTAARSARPGATESLVPLRLQLPQPGASAVHARAREGLRGTPRTLPFLQEIQSSFGKHDVTATRAFTGAKASEVAGSIRADAYSTRQSVVFGGRPSLFTAAHEAAHIVQQRSGVSLQGGLSRAGDPFERHANAVAARVVRGETAEDLLDSAPRGSNTSGEALQLRGPSYLPGTDGPNAFIPLAPAAVSNSNFNLVADRFFAGLGPFAALKTRVPVNPAVPVYPNDDPNDGTELLRTKDINPYVGQIDHIFPESLGGGNSFRNAQFVSAPANNAKQNGYPDPISGLSGTRVFLGTAVWNMPAGTILATDPGQEMIQLDENTANVPRRVPWYFSNLISSLNEGTKNFGVSTRADSITGKMWITLATAQANNLAPDEDLQP